MAMGQRGMYLAVSEILTGDGVANPVPDVDALWDARRCRLRHRH